MNPGTISGFDWDAGNTDKNNKHGVTSADAEEVFFREPLVASDPDHSQKEPRLHALARIGDGRTLHVTFTLREIAGETLIRVISARPASRKERLIYETAKAQSAKVQD
ncbi:MAG TPA: BrnT family toxin [Gammaproteobacteria bacterium]|nr:BrnT family toxin [Gammaproteobacteria bacterium]